MNLPNDFATARAYNGGSNTPMITPGAHICRIRDAKVEQSRSGRDMLVVAFDVADPADEFNGYYAAQYSRRKDYNPDIRWPGIFRATVTNADGRTNSWFKGLITAIEDSNNGFDFAAAGGDENKLTGKYVAFNFGEEEYLDRNTNEVKVTVRPQYAISVGKAKDGVEPPKRKKLREDQMPQPAVQTQAEDDDDALPF